MNSNSLFVFRNILYLLYDFCMFSYFDTKKDIEKAIFQNEKNFRYLGIYEIFYSILISFIIQEYGKYLFSHEKSSCFCIFHTKAGTVLEIYPDKPNPVIFPYNFLYIYPLFLIINAHCLRLLFDIFLFSTINEHEYCKHDNNTVYYRKKNNFFLFCKKNDFAWMI